MSTSPTPVTLYFDVSCPFCWVTSRWIKEVEKVRDVAVTFAPMSLAVLNEGREELPEDYKAKMQANWGPARVFAKVALEQVGLPASFADVADTDEVDGQLREFQARAMERVGNDVGTPVIELGDRAFFGPVLTRIPRGEQAGELFDAAVALGTYPHFFELKRSRDESIRWV